MFHSYISLENSFAFLSTRTILRAGLSSGLVITRELLLDGQRNDVTFRRLY